MIQEEGEKERPNPEAEPAAEPAGEAGWFLLAAITLFIGLGIGFLLWGRDGSTNRTIVSAAPPTPAGQVTVTPENHDHPAGQTQTISLPAEYSLPVTLGDIGPQLVAAGVIDRDRFVELYQQRGQPLGAEEEVILDEGSEATHHINQSNANFWLNFFWALGLANQNRVLTEGPMMQYSEGNVGNFASTGGWTLGKRPAVELYASLPLIVLTEEQQARLEEVAAAVYRPCCDNSTLFPDCNHGMAMLGLLELMASQGATAEEMFTAAKYVNAFWFPQQTLELAAFFQISQGVAFAEVEPRQLVGRQVASGSGFQAVRQWLQEREVSPSVPSQGGSCGV